MNSRLRWKAFDLLELKVDGKDLGPIEGANLSFSFEPIYVFC